MSADADGRYYHPGDGRLGDVIPFGHAGEFHVFFLDYRPERFDFVPPSARKTSWGHLVSRDLERWERLPDAIAPSEDGVDAASCATGSVIERDGVFHLFYTGRSFSIAGDRREVVCEATSTDLVTWTKREDNPVLSPDPSSDELDAFRDPHVYRDPATGEYSMLVTTTRAGGLPRRAGALALARSSDLVRWRRDGFFWAPGSTFDLECADIFSIGDWWYLLFSTAQHTRYRMSRSPYGPWSIPDDDLFDGRWLYAAKTAEVDAECVLFGWLADARPRNDDGERVWGGSLMTRRLVQRRDGSLAVDGSRRSAPPTGLPLGGGRVLDAADGFAALPVASGHDLELEIPVAVPASGRFGLFVRTDELLTEGYRIGFDVGAQTMSWSTVTPAGETLRLSRHCVLHPGAEIVVRATLSGSVVDVVAAGSALCARAFDAPGDRVSIWAEGARISFAEPVLGPQHRGIDK